MKTGKISQAVLDRCVLRPIKLAGLHMADGVSVGGDSACFPVAQGQMAVTSACAAVGEKPGRSLGMLLAGAVDNLEVSGARAQQLVLDLMIPSSEEEETIRDLMKQYASFCAEHRIQPAGGHTEVSHSLQYPVVSITAIGVKKTQLSLRPDEDLVMAGYAGYAGTAILADTYRDMLEQRYPCTLVDRACDLAETVCVTEAARAANHFGVSAMHDVSQGGVFAALWELCEHAGLGLEVELRKIPVLQETIEICEFFDLNPYQLYGQGALLIGTDRGESLVTELQRKGIHAMVIGRTTSGHDRIIRNGEDVRYLDKPVQDMLWKLAECMSG